MLTRNRLIRGLRHTSNPDRRVSAPSHTAVVAATAVAAVVLGCSRVVRTMEAAPPPAAEKSWPEGTKMSTMERLVKGERKKESAAYYFILSTAIRHRIVNVGDSWLNWRMYKIAGLRPLLETDTVVRSPT